MTATLWGRFSMATTAAYSTFRRVWNEPDSLMARNQYAAQVATYEYRDPVTGQAAAIKARQERPILDPLPGTKPYEKKFTWRTPAG